MGRRNRSPEEQERRAKIRELLQLSGVSSMEDIQNLFKETIAEFMEDGLDAELSEDLGRLQEQEHRQQPEWTQFQNPANQFREGGCLHPPRPEGGV